MTALRTLGHKFTSVYNPVDTGGKDYLRFSEDMWYVWNGSGYEPVSSKVRERGLLKPHSKRRRG